MIRSVSTFGRSIGTATAVNRVKARMASPLLRLGAPGQRGERAREGRGLDRLAEVEVVARLQRAARIIGPGERREGDGRNVAGMVGAGSRRAKQGVDRPTG